MLPSKVLDQREENVDPAFIGPDEHAPPLEIAQFAHRQLRLFGKPMELLGIVAEHPAGLGQRPIFGRALAAAREKLRSAATVRKTRNSARSMWHTIRHVYDRFINIDLTPRPDCRTNVNMTTARVTIFDTTLRDGEQAPGFSLRTSEKIELARQLDALGVDIIEAGFPIASLDDAEGVKQVAAHVRRPVIAALARCRTDDIERAGEALRGAERSRIHTFIATSDLHLSKKLNISREQCLEAAVAAITLARQYTDNVQFSAEDATRSDMDFLSRIIEAVINAGFDRIGCPSSRASDPNSSSPPASFSVN
jgi:hypothetical protein